MVDGINENVEAFGRVFHVQTEVTGHEQPVIRTTVFLEGTVVASRKTPLGGRDLPDDALRDRLGVHHGRIVENLQRTAGLEVLMASSDAPEPASSAPSGGRGTRPSKEAPRPDPEADPRLLSSIQVRQLIGPFSQALRPSPYHDDEAVRARVEGAARMIDAIMTAPHFSDVRLDEQVRFFDLRERVAAWRGDGRGTEAASQILLAMVTFAAHLRRISDRRELVAFDYKLLTWAMGVVGRDGASAEALRHLRALAGRDAELDELLGQERPVDGQRLLEVLMGILDRTLPSD